MKELLEFINDLIMSIGKDINSNKGKGVLITAFILIGIILFISPGFIVIFFYNNNILASNFDLVSLFSILIIDSVVFTGLLIIGLVRGVTTPNSSKKEHITYEENILRDIIITIVSMGIISVVLIVMVIILRFNDIDCISRVGILTLIITFLLLNIKHIYFWIKLFYGFITEKINYKKAVRENIKVKQKNDKLPYDDDDEI